MSSEISEVVATAAVSAAAQVRGPAPREVRSDPAVASKSTASPATPEQLRDAVNVLNQHFSAARADLRFTVEKDIGVLVVSVVDSKNGEVLMQLPTEQALRTAREIQRGHSGDHLVKAVA